MKLRLSQTLRRFLFVSYVNFAGILHFISMVRNTLLKKVIFIRHNSDIH